MNQDKLPKYMVSMTNAHENMEIVMYGNTLLNYSITCL